MIIAKWGTYKFNADAQKVAEEIAGIGESATPRQIVDRATDKTSELHKCFTWDDKKAADKWRLQEARFVVCNLVIEQKEPEAQPVRVFHRVGTTQDAGYKRVEIIMQNPDEYQQLLKQAKAELISFTNKYKRLTELERVFEAINEVV